MNENFNNGGHSVNLSFILALLRVANSGKCLLSEHKSPMSCSCLSQYGLPNYQENEG